MYREGSIRPLVRFNRSQPVVNDYDNLTIPNGGGDWRELQQSSSMKSVIINNISDIRNHCSKACSDSTSTTSSSTTIASDMSIGDVKNIEEARRPKQEKHQQQQEKKHVYFHCSWPTVIFYKVTFMLCCFILIHCTIFFGSERSFYEYSDNNSTSTIIDTGSNNDYIRSSAPSHHGQYYWANKNELLTKQIVKNSEIAKKLHHELEVTTKEHLLSKNDRHATLHEIEQISNEKSIVQQKIQQYSKSSSLEKYGPGPHYVEIRVSFDPASSDNDSDIDYREEAIVVELASIDLMPHSVFLFLERVQNKLYDNFSFHINANHVIQAGPVPNFLHYSSSDVIATDNKNKNLPIPKINTNSLIAKSVQIHKQFEESGLINGLFQEYTDAYPHHEYTLGFTSNGPSFYINVENNHVAHGKSDHDHSDGESCFAKVVSGFDAVDRIHDSKVYSDSDWMKHTVAIQSMKIMNKN